MREAPDNPKENCLPNGVTDSALVAAIENSGYPLQETVADYLQADFQIAEEWGFIDRETSQHRSLDVRAFKALSDQDEEKDTVIPGLVLLVECKRSQLPYVCFQSIDRFSAGVPAITGIPNDNISLEKVTGPNRRQSRNLRPSQGLQLDQLPFLDPGPPICAVFSSAQRKGKDLRLSGSVPFNKTIMPLVNALDHSMGTFKTRPNQATLYPTLLVPVAVVDLPLVLVEEPSRSGDPILTPWVRVIRQEAPKPNDPSRSFRYYGIDIVHSGFLATFVETHLLPFAEEFARRVVKHEAALRGSTTVRDLEAWSLEELK